MSRRAFRLAVASLSMFIGCLHPHAQSAPQDSSTRVDTAVDDKENKAILEVGGATSWNFSGGAATWAPNLAVEIEPIENWLELEIGVSPFYTHNSKEWDNDLLFKKPWTLSRKAEFMLGIGPGMGSPQTELEMDQHSCGRSSGRFYVLAERQTSLRLVSGTGLRL
jgi:hypothetical protein